jgi:hypothetical protein
MGDTDLGESSPGRGVGAGSATVRDEDHFIEETCS